jgi:hypothetical protein
MKLLRILFSALMVALAPVAAFAASIPLLSGPQDPSQLNATINNLIVQMNAVYGLGVPLSASGTTAATCNALRCTISVTGLVTADAGALSAVMTVTNTMVTASSTVHCQVNGYGGTTGVPTVVNVTPAAGSFGFQVQNTSTTQALNGTVSAGCVVFN